MNKAHNPDGMMKPLARYSLAVEVPAAARLLFVSGQLGITADGKFAEGIEAQTEVALGNVITLLEAAGMGLEDLVKTTVFLKHAEDFPAYARARDRVFADITPPGTTGVIAGGLVSPEMLVEIDAVAATV